MTKKRFDQPSLFDEPVVLPLAAPAEGPERPGASGRESSIPSLAHPGWKEVPAALFLSWSDARQLEYCARRDEFEARVSMSAEWQQFHRDRAQQYRYDLPVPF